MFCIPAFCELRAQESGNVFFLFVSSLLQELLLCEKQKGEALEKAPPAYPDIMSFN